MGLALAVAPKREFGLAGPAPAVANPLPERRHSGPTGDAGGLPLYLQSSAARPKRVATSEGTEQEADRAADRVVGMPAPAYLHPARPMDAREGGARPILQRRAAGAEGDPPAPSAGPAGLGGGRRLDPAQRDYFEPRFGSDFGNVRLHTDAAADRAARGVDAVAFTYGTHIAFRSGAYAPDAGEGRHLLAHELAHVLQQRSGAARIQRRPAPVPRRARDESQRSRTDTGILAEDVVLSAGGGRLDIYDFPVNEAAPPSAVTGSPGWQRAMSLIAGDPTMRIGVEGFTDSIGTDPENLSLRKRRAQATIALMPAAVRPRVLFSGAFSTGYLDTNATETGRAHNRAVRIVFRSMPAPGLAPCDMITQASSLDQWLFLVRCMEERLALMAPNRATTALSVLRQIYYGSADWSRSEHFVWDYVIRDRPWSEDDDPTPALGQHLIDALRASNVVEGVDVGHVLTGLDAMLHPQNVRMPGGIITDTTLPNEEWATWAGDLGSAASEWALRASAGTPANFPAIFRQFASDSDLRGNVDSFAIRAGGSRAAPSAQLMKPLVIGRRLSDILLDYYGVSSSAQGKARVNSISTFVAAYGGIFRDGKISNPAAFSARLRPAVAEFAVYYSFPKLLSPSRIPPPGAPPFQTFLQPAIDAAVLMFVRWLEEPR